MNQTIPNKPSASIAIAITGRESASEAYQRFLDSVLEKDLQYYSADLSAELGCRDSGELNQAITKAIEVCTSMQIPVNAHFRRVWRSGGEEIRPEWKMSQLGLRLVILNSDPQLPRIARLQFELASYVMRNT